MKRVWLITIILLLSSVLYTAQAQSLKERLLQKATEKANERLDEQGNKTNDEGVNGKEDNKQESENNESTEEPSQTSQENNPQTAVSQNNQPNTKMYQNYDFVPGDKIIFEDDFTDDETGEFPSHWDLLQGQAQVSDFQGEPVFALTEGNYVRVMPLMKTDDYLNTDNFTIEFDYYTQPGAYNQVGLELWDPNNDDQENSSDDEHNAVWVGYDCSANGLDGTYPEDEDVFYGPRWHHVAVAKKDTQLKVYEDQYRVLDVPVFKGKTYALDIVGIGDQTQPIMLKHVRIAEGGDFNDTHRLYTQSRIITHGILFDVDKATLKPQSMGTINEIYKVMKDNPDIKYEIDGYTDNSGTAAHNLTLSQNRADAVKDQLVAMGVSASRLSAKGLGDSNPIDNNDTPEGKANNRRVEFIRVSQ
jgi:OOP family OmpA-OmpF porin